MSFLFPLFLAAGAAILAPLLLHLRRQPPTKVTDFSSLLFLQPSPQVTTTRRKLEKWLLLLLRCLALLLLALMFARPYRASDTSQDSVMSGRAVVILLDHSASMSRGSLWTNALERMNEVIAGLEAKDRLTLATFDSEAVRRMAFADLDAMGPAERAALAKNALAGLKPGQQRTRFDSALIAAVSWLDETRSTKDSTRPVPASREIVLISDLQEGGSLGNLSAFTWPRDVTLAVEPIATDELENRSLALAASDEFTTDQDGQESVRLRLTNAAEADAADYLLTMDADKTPLTTGQIPSGTTRILRVPRPRDDKPHTFQLNDDDWTLDNVVHLAPHQPRKVKIAAISKKANADDASQPLYYLKRALQPTHSVVPQFQLLDETNPASWQDADWMVILPASLSDEALQKARQRLAAGGHALALLTQGTSADALQKLTGLSLGIDEAKVKDYALLADLKQDEAALEPFKDPRLSDLSRIHVWHHRIITQLPSAAKTLVAFDDRSPALVELPVGKGLLHLMMTGWHPKDSQLAHSPHFIALLDGLLSRTRTERPVEHQLLVGDLHPLDGSRLQQSGHVKIDGQPLQIAVNPPPDESRLTPLPTTAFTALGIPLESAQGIAGDKREAVRLENEALELRQQYWLLLLAALLWVVGLETWLAGRKSKSTVEAA